MISETLVTECVHEWVDARVESNNNDANDICDVAILLIFVVVVEFVDD